jgi:hypothetical protein
MAIITIDFFIFPLCDEPTIFCITPGCSFLSILQSYYVKLPYSYFIKDKGTANKKYLFFSLPFGKNMS